jgi:hypothetical protein
MTGATGVTAIGVVLVGIELVEDGPAALLDPPPPPLPILCTVNVSMSGVVSVFPARSTDRIRRV